MKTVWYLPTDQHTQKRKEKDSKRRREGRERGVETRGEGEGRKREERDREERRGREEGGREGGMEMVCKAHPVTESETRETDPNGMI